MDDTAEHVLPCGTDENTKQRNIKDNIEKEWQEVVQVLIENNKKRKERRKFQKRKDEFRQMEEEQKVRLKLVCAIFYQIFISHQKIALQKLQ